MIPAMRASRAHVSCKFTKYFRCAVRELAEESGITGAACVRGLGTWEQGPEDQVWHFCVMAVSSALPDVWRHRTDDDSGHVFACRWHNLAEPAPSSCHPIFQRSADGASPR